MKKVLLIRAPEKYLPHRKRPMAYMPTGLMLIAACLEKHDIAVDIIDGALPDEIRDGGDNFFGITFDDIRKKIEQVDYDIVGISAQFTLQWDNSLELIRLCKEIRPDSALIVGGAHSSVEYENILNKVREVDFVVRGEGEIVFPALVRALRRAEPLEDIKGIVYRKKEKIIVNDTVFIDELDSLPYPAYHLIDVEKYFELEKEYATRTRYEFDGNHRSVTVITSRGCPFGCVFCSIHLHMGRRWRAHSSDYVLGHIEMLVKNYGVRFIHFEDDNISFDRDRFDSILQGIMDRKFDVRWDTPNGVRADTFDEDLLEKCKLSGCVHLTLGVESGVQRVLDDVIRKSIKLERVERTMRLGKKIGVDMGAFFMIGIPGETKEDIKSTVDYILNIMWKYECFGGFGMAVPLYGTVLYDICRDRGYFARDPSLDNLYNAFWDNGIIRTEEFTPEYLDEMREYFDAEAKRLLFIIFLRKIVLRPWLFLYVIKNIQALPMKQWSSIYYRVLFFEHSMWFDKRKKYRRT